MHTEIRDQPNSPKSENNHPDIGKEASKTQISKKKSVSKEEYIQLKLPF